MTQTAKRLLSLISQEPFIGRKTEDTAIQEAFLLLCQPTSTKAA
jgi:hypothetical protein